MRKTDQKKVVWCGGVFFRCITIIHPVLAHFLIFFTASEQNLYPGNFNTLNFEHAVLKNTLSNSGFRNLDPGELLLLRIFLKTKYIVLIQDTNSKTLTEAWPGKFFNTKTVS
jgi:hypothetical protein